MTVFGWALPYADTLSTAAPLASFDGAVGASFALALAYSILLKLGNFSGTTLDEWVHNEKLRVLPPIAEDTRFDKAAFTDQLHECRDAFKSFIRLTNIFFVSWALTAAAIDLPLFIIIPFGSATMIDGYTAAQVGAVLLGPIPLGMIVIGLLHLSARMRMRGLSKEFSTVIKYSNKAPAEAIKAARAALQEQLDKERKP